MEVQKLLRQARLEQQEKAESRVDRLTRRGGGVGEPFVAENWREIPAKELAAMPRVAQSRYQAVSICIAVHFIVHTFPSVDAAKHPILTVVATVTIPSLSLHCVSLCLGITSLTAV